MKSGNRPPLTEVWVISLLLGLGLFNFPFVEIFNKDRLVFGIPLLVLYFYLGWALVIGVIGLFVRRLHASIRGEGEDLDNP